MYSEKPMSLNYKEIDAVLAELDIENAFIQQIVQPGYDSLALYVYKTSYQNAKVLYMCLAAGECRIHETKRNIPKTAKPLRFMEFLKSRVKGCKIASCRQIGKERIVRLELERSGEKYRMFIKLWSGAANVLLTDENLCILDAFYRRPKRKEVSGGIFTLPKIDGEHIRAAQKTFEIRNFDELLAAEKIDSTDLSLNEKIDLWYGEHGERCSRSALLLQAEKKYGQAVNRIQGALQRLEEKRKDFENAALWKHQGDLILAHAHLLNAQKNKESEKTAESSANNSVPKNSAAGKKTVGDKKKTGGGKHSGTSSIECTDYENGGSIVCLKIDPLKSAAQNAQMYYTKYKKAASGSADLERDIEDLKAELQKVQSAWDTIRQEENPVRMKQLLQKNTSIRAQQKKKRPGVAFFIDGWDIFAGRSAAENDELLRHYVKGQDMWLHTRDWSGGYIFIKSRRGKTIPLEILLDAGNLAVFYSKARKAKTADIYYTQVKHLRRAKNAPKGTVLPSHEKNLTVTIDEQRLRKMEKLKKDD